jgi:hypothetical protein
MSWKSEDLWKKACLYYSRAFEHDREDPLFPLWSSIGLEFLARAALAKVHPSLLADPMQGENVLYACGFPSAKPPKSVSAKTVFHRLTVVMPGFTSSDFKFCTALMEMRNAELHSGELPFDKYATTKWYPQLCRISKLMAEYCGKSLAELFGPKESKAALELVDVFKSKLRAEVTQLIKQFKQGFALLNKSAAADKIKGAKLEVSRHSDWKCRKLSCPACKTEGLLQGDILKVLEAKATEEGIEEKAIIIPTRFSCYACGLSLPTSQHLYFANMADQHTKTTFSDPRDYYGIEFDRNENYEPDYGND